MQTPTTEPTNNGNDRGGLTFFIIKRVVIALVVIISILWALSVAIDNLGTQAPLKAKVAETPSAKLIMAPEGSAPSPLLHAPGAAQPAQSPANAASRGHGSSQDDKGKTSSPQFAATSDKHVNAAPAKALAPQSAFHGATSKAVARHAPPTAAADKPVPAGVAFVEAVMAPISYELEERFWGWRPNDIISLTDNVNHYQLGVLEVTRRSVVQLTERISRTGSADAINRNLENAMNSLMVSADRFWFPSPESKYKESLAELARYRKNLIIGEATFYTRTDSIIPLLAAYEDLLGSCDENLVKVKEKDGATVGFFQADNYFYYAKGVADAMADILEAVAHDFETLLANRHGEELLHHAIMSCQTAASLEPWLITNGSLDGILANHRAHMAAPISHARFYIGQLIKTLST